MEKVIDYKKEYKNLYQKTILCFIFCFLCTAATTAQDKRAKIKDYLNQEILIEDNFAGQSITLVKEKKDYFILRKYFGSGVPIIATVKYKVVFNSEFQIEFGTEIIGSFNVELTIKNEVFRLETDERGINLFLNGLKVVIN